MNPAFHIYRSSAGSGKTYTLARSYLLLALRHKDAFRHILGVTFTNKATEEMKQRILKFLKDLKAGADPELSAFLEKELSISSARLQQEAGKLLSSILHQYGRFSVVTIDSFFHQVIRSFAREMGLQGTFTIDLDLDKVLQEVVDMMLLDIGKPENKQLRQWLTRFAEDKVEQGKSWDFRGDIQALAKEIMSDDFKVVAGDIFELGKKPKFFTDLLGDFNKQRKAFEAKLMEFQEGVEHYLDTHGIDAKEFSSGWRGNLGMFVKVNKADSLDKRFEFSAGRIAAIDEPSAWLTKAKQEDARLHQALNDYILPQYKALYDFIDQGLMHYCSVVEAQRYFYTYGILSYIHLYLQQYRDENDVMLIADLPDFLRQIIRDSDTPYIYEKVGSMFNHYLIDEFQDTSVFQWDNFKPLVKNATDQGDFCLVVGDVKQSIYRFRGGEWGLLEHQIKGDIGAHNTHEEYLTFNWRSAPALVDFNNQFFTGLVEKARLGFLSEVTDVHDPALASQVSAHIEEVFHTFRDVTQQSPEHKADLMGHLKINFIDTDEDETWKEVAVQKLIVDIEQLQDAGYALREIAVLTRTSGEGKMVADALIAYRNSSQARPDCRYEVVSSEALLLSASHAVRFITALIHWLHNEKNTIALSEWVYQYRHYILTDSRKADALFDQVQNWEQLVPEAFLKQKDYFKTLPLYELVESLIRIFTLDQIATEFTYLQGFQDAILDYGKNERGDMASFLEWWEEKGQKRSIQISEKNDAIKILTMHKAKGLEFPVVLLPFLDWKIEQSGNSDRILWCQGVQAAPFDRLPVIPLKYGKILAKTYWASTYFDEKLKSFLDNLNLLYVAFTRPIEVLIGYGQLPKKEDQSNTISDILYPICNSLDGWDAESLELLVNSMPKRKAAILTENAFELSQYSAFPWRGKVSLQMKDAGELAGKVMDHAQDYGIQMHQWLSQIRYEQDLEQFSALPEYDDLVRVVQHVDVRSWFDQEWEVKTEVPILLPGGDLKRMDRINRRGDETHIIDYKTGSPRPQDQKQVAEYIKIMKDMGIAQVKGYLIYLEQVEVIEIHG